MKKQILFTIPVLLIASIIFFYEESKYAWLKEPSFDEWKRPMQADKKVPNEDFFLQRSYPDAFVDPVAYRRWWHRQ